jgi:hypothetical protein
VNGKQKSTTRRIKCSKKMTQADIESIVLLLENWANTHARTPLTWSRVEKRVGFTRTALSQKEQIQTAFESAKKVQRDVKERTSGSPDEVTRLRRQVEELTIELELLQRSEDMWLNNWQRVLANLREMGLNAHDILAPISASGRLHTEDAIAAYKGERRPRASRKRNTADKK